MSKSIFKKGKHFRIERFGIGAIILISCMALVLASCLFSKIKESRTAMTEDAVYSTEFITSRTKQQGDVIDVYTSKDKTKAFLLLKFENMSQMSRDANNYEAFLTGSTLKMKKDKLKSAPSGIIYMFGSTGYMGIYMVETEGFPKQILDLTVRCDVELATVDESAIETDYDESFLLYDQFKIYFNPGGTAATTLDCLNSEKPPTAYDLYTQSVIALQEKELRETLDADVVKLHKDLQMIDEATSRVSALNIQVPKAPAVISGDKVDVDKQEDGTEILTYKPAKVVAHGFNFDWRSGSVYEGYIDKLIAGKKVTYMQYLKSKSDELDDKFELPDGADGWLKVDGTPIPASADEAESAASYASMIDDITSLIRAWDTYYEDKKQYQTEDLKELLSLEIEAKSIKDSVTVNSGEYSLYCY